MINKVKIINLPKIEDPRGNLTFIEENNHIPFEIKRVHWIYDVPGGVIRGGHAYRKNKQFIIALSGSFDVIIKDGKTRKKYSLNRSYFGLYIPNLLWRSLENFSTNALAFTLSSTLFDVNDYIRDFSEFKKLLNK
jgi:dTDP-4-dehydrorhamnose 3,5-epimerase-like enzyme